MIYIKSLIAGIVAVMIATVLTLVVTGVYISITYKPKEDVGIGFDPISFMRDSLVRIIIVVSFLAGFIWEFRR